MSAETPHVSGAKVALILDDPSVIGEDWRPEFEQMRDAAHMLHEQAHGGSPWRTCTEEPCRLIERDLIERGPAPRYLEAISE